MAVKSHIVLLNIGKQLVSTENFGDLDKLVVVVLTLEERLFLEDHTSKHATQGPDVQRVVIDLQVDK